MHSPLSQIAAATSWHAQVQAMISEATRKRIWITREELESVTRTRPDPSLPARAMRSPTVMALLTTVERNALDFIGTDLQRLVSMTNQEILDRELIESRHFFDHVEKSPLTEEQARAVICMDNRVQVVAAAGSGKTSVMVARAAYAVIKGRVPPERILLLAFNKKAAHELAERIGERLGMLNVDTSRIRASTFHSFGLDVIGEATGRKPRVAPWVTDGQDVEMVSRIVDGLRDRSTTFRFRWDLFRLLFARMNDSPDGGEPDGYDPQAGRTGFNTYAGAVVKSEGERLIADWLFLNGVEFAYEKEYTFDTADATHAQYRPDFYYPAIDVWHEHWALDGRGHPPSSFVGYTEGMEWKRRVHQRNGTTLVESTFAQIVTDGDFAPLERSLTELGLDLDWNPDRPIPGAKPVPHEGLARLIRTFMTHVKSNCHTRESLDRLLGAERSGLNTFRTRLFLDIYWPIHDEWQSRLQAGNLVDYEEMLVAAADHLEKGRVDRGYQLVMVDEFQDASHARARILACLLNKPGCFLMAVGDDWQSVNRFAGADLGPAPF
jgi:DNA helicase IV